MVRVDQGPCAARGRDAIEVKLEQSVGALQRGHLTPCCSLLSLLLVLL